ncbi:3-oxo-Delta(4,5)-steroid 5-beta-reductase [Panicum miliaceum]|uniref:3-oxo-Delta(4,5)-steroid 5-beta-reductase n=1 Tax=Panicum miliaceum TaxID=4540 RepID=A0A3L6SAC9_PANMI|nr:3-oxo-Delta(4,5)-steroid 5-beta-reductase [Panicum miliaceum]
MMRWCWTGAYGAIERRHIVARAAAEAAATAPQKVALVVGSTGVVGAALLDILRSPDTPAGPWKVYALSCGPLPPWSAPAGAPSSSNPNPVIHLQLDLADPAAVAQALKPLTDITHVFYTACSACPGATEDDAREANCAMLRNVLSVVIPRCPALVHVCLQTGRKGFVDPFEPMSGIFAAIVAMRPYPEDVPRLEHSDLEDVFLDEVAHSWLNGAAGAITWSVHRPATLFGFSPRSESNVIASLCVYAAICCKEGAALRWPGSLVAWEGFSDASDAELVAEHALWAALEPSGKNETFNCTNGDVYKWKNLWPMLADHFEMEWSGYDGEDKRFKLEEAMAGKETLWAEIVREKGLVETELNDITAWWFVDALINADKEQIENMNKSKERGCLGFRNTVRSFNTWIGKLKADKIVP